MESSSASRIRIYKKQDEELCLVGTYTLYEMQELAKCRDVSSFIRDHIGPMWGFGGYEIRSVDDDGKEFGAQVIVFSPQKPLKVYVAGPMFSSGLIDDNIRQALEVGHQIKELGAIPVIPHLFFFWDLIFPRPEEYWKELDSWIVPDCDVTFRLEGYSEGADDEEGWSKKIFKNKPELFKYIMAYNLRVYGNEYGERGKDDQG
jgi:hypothetical protein